jgi:hypothetical protein
MLYMIKTYNFICQLTIKRTKKLWMIKLQLVTPLDTNEFNIQEKSLRCQEK